MKKPTRVAAIIETPYGVLLEQDRNDRHAQKQIEEIEKDEHKTIAQKEQAIAFLKDGRFCLPGGKIEEKETPHQALIREIHEELNLEIEKHHIAGGTQIQGKTRDHIIFVVRATGLVQINPDEVTGIGLLNNRTVLPNDPTFMQHHVREILSHYIYSNRRRKYRCGFMSTINISKKYVDDWLEDEERICYYRGPSAIYKGRLLLSGQLESVPNFTIFKDGFPPLKPEAEISFTRSVLARFIPALRTKDKP